MSFKPTEQQKKAIEATLGAVLVVAGPGAGKTFCLIGRIGHLISRRGLAADRVLAVTFTNKAAEEVAERLDAALGTGKGAVHSGTIHSLCADILREHAGLAGLKPGFGIADEEYQRTLLRQMRQGQRSGQLLNLFTRRQLAGYPLTPGDEQVFREYQRTLRRRNIVDFDDILVLTTKLFDEQPAVADDVAARWDYVLVDEFQDVNRVQYAILRRLAEKHGNILAVGDDEQSIFSWAGAEPDILQRFQRDYGIAAPIVLDRNWRTSQQIFGVARRLLEGNRSLFDKELYAPRLSPFEVRALDFPDDDAEAAWIIGDIARDRDANNAEHPESPLDWGDYALLYRRHDVGYRLETALLKAGLPCRLAKGRALSQDRVIGQVISAIQLVSNPNDASAAEKYARWVLPPHLMQRVEAEAAAEDGEYLRGVRDLAGTMPQGDPDTKKLWRLVYAVENLAAMRTKHATLSGLIEELLTERAGVYTNVLENRHEDLADPLEVPAAAALAARLRLARAAKSRVVIEPMNGLEIAVRGLLFGAGFKIALYDVEVVQAELDDCRVGPADAGPEGLAYTLFKALQAVHADSLGGPLARYVTFDLETTGKDTRGCEIVEIAAVRAEGGRVVEEFHSLVCPSIPIEPEAQRKHGYAMADVQGAPPFREVWPRFLAFIGGDPLVAHNGQDFDVPVLRRMAASAGWTGQLQAYDTLPLARSLGGGGASLEALAHRFGVPLDHAHHALDDSRALVGVYEGLEQRRLARARKAGHVNLLPYLGLALALDQGRWDTDEVVFLRNESAIRALGRFSDCLEFYEAERNRLGLRGLSIEEVIERLGGKRLMDKLREERDAASRYPEAVARLEALIEQRPGDTLQDAISRFLERVTLSATQEGADVEAHRVNLLTLHSTKGLEFSRVYVVGVEDEQLPGFIPKDENPDHAIQETRRLLYVGMTRAIERLVLTRVDRRHGKPGGGNKFLDEMGLVPERVPGVALMP